MEVFEETIDFEYDLPFSAFPNLLYWRAAAHPTSDSSRLTTPDLFVAGQATPASTPLSYWNIVSGASQGINHVGLVNVVTQDGAFLPETIATQLLSPLEAGAYYALTLDYRNKGRDNFHLTPMMCIEEAQKKLVFYFDDQPISVFQNEVENTSTPTAEQFVELHTPSMKPYRVSNWESIGSCFQANGSEKYIALSMTTGRVAVYPPCEILDESVDIFLTYYFDVDNIRLEKIPTSYQINARICTGQPLTLNLRDSIRLPQMLQPVYFSFLGENTDGELVLNQEGEYLAYAHFDCALVPIQLLVTEFDCSPQHYAPNTFSPNFDGVNDNWQVFLKPSVVIRDF
ncbi:MAG: hypothetical protein HC821_04905 [Lewinella sp.]|nr:hypothetical protein [Lewinella sp.]